jgi:hypothetical protein
MDKPKLIKALEASTLGRGFRRLSSAIPYYVSQCIACKAKGDIFP